MTQRQWSYRRYLESRTWHLIREEVRQRVRDRFGGYLGCEDCMCRGRGCVGGYHCHHTLYPRILGHEDPRSVLHLCSECHRKRHPGWRPEPLPDVETSPTFEELFRLLDELG